MLEYLEPDEKEAVFQLANRIVDSYREHITTRGIKRPDQLEPIQFVDTVCYALDELGRLCDIAKGRAEGRLLSGCPIL